MGIDEFWAAYFGVDTSAWSTPGVTVTRHVGLGNYRGIWFFHRRAHWIISAPENWVGRLRSTTATLDPNSFMQESTLRHLVGDDYDRCIGPAFRGYLEPGQFRRIVHPTVRPLMPADRPLVEAIAEESRKNDWNPLEVGTEFQNAAFIDGRIAALSGYRRWSGDAGDPFIFVQARHRRMGLGAAVTSAVVEQALLAGKMLLYQTLESNEPAVRIALRLGYLRDSTHMAVRLRIHG